MVQAGTVNSVLNRFSSRMVLGVLFIQLLAFPLFLYGFLMIVEQGFKDRFINQVRSSSYWVASLANPILLNQEKEKLDQLLNEAVMSGEVHISKVLDMDGSVLSTASASTALDVRYQEDFFFGQHGDNLYFISVPILSGNGDPYGMLMLGYDETPTQEQIHAIYIRGITIAGIYGGTTLMLVLVFGYYLGKPIKRLQQMARAIASGDHSRKLRVKTRISEISNLAGDLDRMCEALIHLRIEAQEREARLEAIMDNVCEGIVVTDDRFAIRSANAMAIKIFGYSMREIVGKNLSNLLSLNDPIAEIESVVRANDGRNVGDICERICLRRDGSQFPAEISVGEALVGEEHLFVVILQDITQRKQIEKERALSKKLEAVGQLAAGVAHEINTPTQYVMDNTRFIKDCIATLLKLNDAYSELLVAVKANAISSDLVMNIEKAVEAADLDYLTEEAPEALIQSLNGLEQIGKIVGAMKAFSHPGTDHKQSCDLNSIVENSLIVSRNEWKYVAEVTTDLDSTLPLVHCFPQLIGQVILNLVVNAAHAIEATGKCGKGIQGRIRISTGQCDDGVVLQVSDNGVGIDAALCDRIFDPFYTTKEVGKGTGQGLSLSRAAVVERHNGTLTVESETGCGAVFTITLPITECEFAGAGAVS